MSDNPIIATAPLSAQWQTLDPFLFCVHHKDDYPGGNAQMGLDRQQLTGRNLGMDFSGQDGWSMYHGDMVPGFPRHPHRGFETVTLARRGYIDHSDSLGAAARFGNGDVQWMTAGSGIVHSEMFPLVNEGTDNPTELFQIWLNLPAANKMADPYFSMLWSGDVPRLSPRGSTGTEVVLVAGALEGAAPPIPPPASWASNTDSHVAIWTITMAADGRWTLPAAQAGLNRVLYLFAGKEARVHGQAIAPRHAIQLRSDAAVELAASGSGAEFLLLQGRPIAEPVAQHGPFVMNSSDEIRQAISDFQASGFGGWPWPADGPVHAREQQRFARYPDGSLKGPQDAAQTLAQAST